jgi:hypothetical protein
MEVKMLNKFSDNIKYVFINRDLFSSHPRTMKMNNYRNLRCLEQSFRRIIPRNRFLYLNSHVLHCCAIKIYGIHELLDMIRYDKEHEEEEEITKISEIL